MTKGAAMDHKDRELGLEVWKATLEVQRHFNDLGLRVRSLAITVLGAFMAAAGYAFKEQNNNAAGLILSAGLVCWLAFLLHGPCLVSPAAKGRR